MKVVKLQYQSIPLNSLALDGIPFDFLVFLAYHSNCKYPSTPKYLTFLSIHVFFGTFQCSLEVVYKLRLQIFAPPPWLIALHLYSKIYQIHLVTLTLHLL